MGRSLPDGWFWSNDDEKTTVRAEYHKELPPVHPLVGVAIEVVADRGRGSDDILVQHLDIEGTVSAVHLTWIGTVERPNHPTVDFTGTFAEFCAWECSTYGVAMP